MRFFLLLLIVGSILEIWLMIKVGTIIGAAPTILLIVVTGLLGITLLRWQGLDTLFRAGRRLEGGELPAQEILEGMVLAVSGALLLVPGFVTDAVGLVGLIPPLRRRLMKRMFGELAGSQMGSYRHRTNKVAGGNVIEGEFSKKK